MTEEIKESAAEEKEEKAFKFKKPAFLNTKKGMTITIIVAVLLVAGGGFWAWHNTPGFCGTMCHSSMGNYTDGYNNNEATLAYAHGHIDGDAKDTLKASAKDTNSVCLDCHPASLDLQIIEFVEQVSGRYTMDTEGNVVIEGTKNFVANKEFCTQCHDYEKVVAATENYNGGKHDSESGVFNPHASHQGDLECSTCHNVHGTSVMYCTQCHNAEVPEGWETYAESVA